MFPLEPIWARTPKQHGCTPLGECVRVCWNTFGPVRQGNLLVRTWASVYVFVEAGLGLYAGKPVYTHLGESARARSFPFGPVQFGAVHHQNLALRPLLSMHVLVLARLGL